MPNARVGQYLAALSIFLTCCTVPADPGLSQDEPAFGKSKRYVSDVQWGIGFAPDNRKVSILFDNLALELGAEPIATKVFSISLPVENSAADLRITLDVRGSLQRDEGASAALVLIVNGQANALQVTEETDQDFLETFETTLSADTDLRLSLVLSLDRDADEPALAALDG